MITAFMNMKGGVGKTTLCVHLAGAAAHNGKKVLIIDYDPQFNLTQHLLKPEEYYDLDGRGKTVYRILQPQPTTPSPFQVTISADEYRAPKLATVTKNLFTVKRTTGDGAVDLVPGSGNLMYLVLGKNEGSTLPMARRFHAFLADADKRYDHVLIDCHPAGSFLTKSAIVVAEQVVVPIIPDSYSQRGLVLMTEFLDFVCKFGKIETQPRVVFNNIPWTGYDSKVETGIRSNSAFKDFCVAAVIHSSKSISTAGQVKGHSWQRMMQWSVRPWGQRVKRELNKLYKELFEG